VTASVSQQAGYLLHYTQYGDASFIVDFFSMEHGRISLMAKSARSSKPVTRALYQPFRPLLVSWWGENELRTLTGIEDSGNALVLAGTALPCGYYLNEILLRLLPKDQTQKNVFAHYALALAELAASPDRPEPVLRQFELQLLEGLGLLPDFVGGESQGDAIDEDAHYLFYPALNRAVLQPDDLSAMAIPKIKPTEPVFHDDGETVAQGTRISGKALMALANFDIDHKDILAEIKPVMRQTLQLYLGSKPLNSRELFSSLTPPPPPPMQSTNSD